MHLTLRTGEHGDLRLGKVVLTLEHPDYKNKYTAAQQKVQFSSGKVHL